MPQTRANLEGDGRTIGGVFSKKGKGKKRGEQKNWGRQKMMRGGQLCPPL